MRKTGQSEKSAGRNYEGIVKDHSITTQFFQPPIQPLITAKRTSFILLGS